MTKNGGEFTVEELLLRVVDQGVQGVEQGDPENRDRTILIALQHGFKRDIAASVET